MLLGLDLALRPVAREDHGQRCLERGRHSKARGGSGQGGPAEDRYCELRASTHSRLLSRPTGSLVVAAHRHAAALDEGLAVPEGGHAEAYAQLYLAPLPEHTLLPSGELSD